MVCCKSHSAKGRHGGLSKDTQDPTMSRSEGGDLDAQCVLSHMKSRKSSSLASLGAGFEAPKVQQLVALCLDRRDKGVVWDGGGRVAAVAAVAAGASPTEAVVVEAAIAGTGAGPWSPPDMTDDG